MIKKISDRAMRIFLKKLYTLYLNESSSRFSSDLVDENSDIASRTNRLGYLRINSYNGNANNYDYKCPSKVNPLSEKGKKFLDNSWYLAFKEKTWFQIIRDIFALAGGLVAIILTMMQIKGRI